MPSPLIAPTDPALRDRATLLLDARSGPDARQRYEASHLAGARHIDLEVDLSDVPDDAAQGGRHPLPSPAVWGRTLGRLGVSPERLVVVYDDKGGANAAARTWWMLRAAGHSEDRVFVLDGGMEAAVAAGVQTESGAPEWDGADDYPVSAWAWPTVDIDVIRGLPVDGPRRLVDVRAAERHRGEVEPIDPVAGHLPGAVNHPLANHLGPDGRFLSPDVLRAQLEALLDGRAAGDAIYSCGSGVTACHGILAMVHAGLDVPALYVGSWSEWCRQRGA